MIAVVNSRGVFRRCRRSGYTLLETLLAMALLLVLLGTVATATSLFLRYRSQTTDRIIPTIVLNGLREDIACDLRAISSERYPDSTPSIAIDSQLSSASISERFLDLGLNSSDIPIGFVGDEQAFALLRAGRNSRFRDAGSPDSEAEYSVLWMSPQRNETRLATHRSGNQTIERTFKRPSSQHGLLRMEFAKDNASGAIFNTIEEVDQIAFQYYDGKVWHNRWNSFLRGDQLPRAVELIIELHERKGTFYRTVVSIPTGQLDLVILDSKTVHRTEPSTKIACLAFEGIRRSGTP